MYLIYMNSATYVSGAVLGTRAMSVNDIDSLSLGGVHSVLETSHRSPPVPQENKAQP